MNGHPTAPQAVTTEAATTEAVTADAVIVAAGRGERAGAGEPKQYRLLDGEPVLLHSVRSFLAIPAIRRIAIVVREDDRSHFDAAMGRLTPDEAARVMSVAGGATRQASVRYGLEALASMAASPAVVLIHDAARPFASASLITDAIAAAARWGAAIPGVAVTDTIKTVDETGRVTATPPRPGLRAVQTPQAFAFADILAAHRAALETSDDFTDDAAIAEWAGMEVRVFPGDPRNVKLTHPRDFPQPAPATLVSRTGIGYDVHAFASGDHVWIGGVRLECDMGVTAHSDGDVGLHALTDALLGVISDGDIGSHFPPSDPQWAGASSDRFLAYAAARVRERGGIIDHLDLTIVCETPKIGPARERIRTRIAEIAGVAISSVSVKATTSERLGFTGRREGLAAHAAASVRLPV